MFRLWAKMWKENRLLRDMTVEDDSGANRTKKVFDAVEKVCVAWDLPKPIWLQANIRAGDTVLFENDLPDNYTE